MPIPTPTFLFQSAPWFITTENQTNGSVRLVALRFQSAPWFITTENPAVRLGSASSAGFNPLRGSSPRRTRSGRHRRRPHLVSIRSVVHHHGEHGGISASPGHHCGFNPLRGSSPRRTVAVDDKRIKFLWFQSAPWFITTENIPIPSKQRSPRRSFNPLRGSSPRRTPRSQRERRTVTMFQSAPWFITTENAARSDRSCGSRKFQSAPWFITTENRFPACGLWASVFGVCFANPAATRPVPIPCLLSTSL